jgi:cell division protein FtsB
MAARRQGIRWDRIGRWTLLLVFALIAFLYIGPARSWISAYAEAHDKREQVAELQARNAELRRRRAALKAPTALESEARRLGMVRAGERAYVIRGLPDG